MPGQKRSDAGEEYDEHAGADQELEGLGIGKREAEDDEGLIEVTEPVEEEPREVTGQDEQGNQAGEWGDGDGDGDDCSTSTALRIAFYTLARDLLVILTLKLTVKETDGVTEPNVDQLSANTAVK